MQTHNGLDNFAQQDWLFHILDTIDEGIHAVDVSGVTIFYNAAAGRLDGMNPQDVLGRHVLSVFPSLETETSTLLQVLRTGTAMHDRPQVYTNFHGVKVHTVNTTLPILSGGRIVGALEVAKDLTQVRRLSEQVIALQAQVAGTRGRRRAGGRDTANGAQQAQAVYRFSNLLANDARMTEAKRRAERAAQTSSPILVYGETGTGKELLVQAIHNASPRRGHPFMALNCAALPAPLLEGILFGTVRGSFTGAEDRSGLFELADDGTLFLDEIQSMSLELQAKLLRVLQEGELMRVGDTSVTRVNVRVVAAMNADPEEVLRTGRLRSDLYYRINVVRVNLPPLRERRDDLPMLTAHFIEKWNGRFGTRVTGVSRDVAAFFRRYPWPGNVRELENAIEAALNLVSEGALTLDALPGHLRDWLHRSQADEAEEGAVGIDFGVGSGRAENSAQTGHLDEHEPPYGEWADILVTEGMEDYWKAFDPNALPTNTLSDVTWQHLETTFEAMVLQRVLRAVGGNVKAAAERLGMPRQTLQYRIKQLNLR